MSYRNYPDLNDTNAIKILNKWNGDESFTYISYYEMIDNNIYYLKYCYNNLKIMKINLETFENDIILNIDNNNLMFMTSKLTKKGIYVLDNKFKLNFIDFTKYINNINLGNFQIIEKLNDNCKINKIIKSNNEIYYISNEYNTAITNITVYNLLDENYNIIFTMNLVHNNVFKYYDNPNKNYIKNNSLYVHGYITSSSSLTIKYINGIFIAYTFDYIITCNKNEILSFNYYNYMRFISDRKIIFKDYDKVIIYDIIDKSIYFLDEQLWNYYHSITLINNKYILIYNTINHILLEIDLNYNLNNMDIYIDFIKLKYNNLNINEALEIIKKMLEKYNFKINQDNIKKDLFLGVLLRKYKYIDIMNNINDNNFIIHKELIIFDLKIINELLIV